MNRDGRNGTNGGAGGPTVTVNNYSALVSAVADHSPRVVQISGSITGSGMVRVGSNKTIIGLGTSAAIDGFGLNVSGFDPTGSLGDSCDQGERGGFTETQNVIIRNITFRNADDDSVNVQCWSHHVWIDHNTFYPGVDGSVDIKRGSDWATVSWNRFIGTDKSMLLGHSDDNGAQDRTHLHVTYHHNWLDHSNTRHPRVRFGQAHIYNNYGNGITDYFIGAGVECDIHADHNNLDGIKRIITYWDGVKVTYDSTNVNTGECRADDCLVQNGQGFNPGSYYSTSPDSATSIPSIVSGGAGAGRL